AAEAHYRQFQMAPPGFSLLGESPEGGRSAPATGRAGFSAGAFDRIEPALVLTTVHSVERSPAPAPPQPVIEGFVRGPAPYQAKDISLSPARHVADAVIEWWGDPVVEVGL